MIFDYFYVPLILYARPLGNAGLTFSCRRPQNPTGLVMPRLQIFSPGYPYLPLLLFVKATDLSYEGNDAIQQRSAGFSSPRRGRSKELRRHDYAPSRHDSSLCGVSQLVRVLQIGCTRVLTPFSMLMQGIVGLTPSHIGPCAC